MNKNVWIAIVLIALAGGAYYQFSYKPGQVAAMAKAAEDAATKAADEAAATAKAAEDAAAAAAKKLADDAAAAASAAGTAVTDGAAAVTEGAATSTTDMMAALDPANFDAAKISAMIDASALDAGVKTTLKAGIEAAAADPTKVASALAAVKTAMGM